MHRRALSAGQAIVQGLQAEGVKAVYEVAATPLTYLVVGILKRREGLDTYDRGTDFSPFSLG